MSRTSSAASLRFDVERRTTSSSSLMWSTFLPSVIERALLARGIARGRRCICGLRGRPGTTTGVHLSCPQRRSAPRRALAREDAPRFDRSPKPEQPQEQGLCGARRRASAPRQRRRSRRESRCAGPTGRRPHPAATARACKLSSTAYTSILRERGGYSFLERERWDWAHDDDDDAVMM